MFSCISLTDFVFHLGDKYHKNLIWLAKIVFDSQQYNTPSPIVWDTSSKQMIRKNIYTYSIGALEMRSKNRAVTIVQSARSNEIEFDE